MLKSKELIIRLDNYLGNPKYDPHGDPIPDEHGNLRDERVKCALSNLKVSEKGIVIGVEESSVDFLQYLDSIKLTLGTEVEILERFPFDQSVKIGIQGQQLQVSKMVAKNLIVKPVL